VEIVGRDGVIRRYTFEDSIRLYQRRVTFAPIRYRDRDLIDAEVHHCRHRIDQLRRSFFYRYGWGTPDGQPDPELVFGDLAGELAAFVRRVLRADDRPDVRLEAIEEGSDGVSTWFLVPSGADTGMLLYVHRFEVEDREAARERFFTTLKSLERPERDGDGERLLAFHHSADCGFILTGQAGQFESLEQLSQSDGVIRDISPSLWDRLVDQVRLGQYQDALTTGRRLLREQPHHRRAYVVGSALACFLGRFTEAEEIAILGGLYFPSDGALLYWRGVACWRQGRLADAAEALERALEAAPELALARFLLVVVCFDQGRWWRAGGFLRGRIGIAADERRAGRALDALARAGRMFVLAMTAGLVLSGVGLLVVPVVGAVGVVPALVGLIFGVLAVVAFRHELGRLLARQRFDDVGSWVRRAAREEPRTLNPL
jgi:tetratricopeptide (TPR) repeat protein